MISSITSQPIAASLSSTTHQLQTHAPIGCSKNKNTHRLLSLYFPAQHSLIPAHSPVAHVSSFFIHGLNPPISLILFNSNQGCRVDDFLDDFFSSPTLIAFTFVSFIYSMEYHACLLCCCTFAIQTQFPISRGPL
ncbi:hypothetical protein I3842_14G034500 [Carya illinoinensis]|uniref:Uncharacterized protein n=1 Tax=Carya illinoinensis TaxID=32201 RepID=A0A922D8F5_CARIL|nr:hypothetical protein I3842_14G034500 [Carya illinoinensis]